MNKATKHTETTQYLHESKTCLYRFMYAFIYDFIHNADHFYDAFGNMNYDYFCSNMSYKNNIFSSSTWITDASGSVNQHLAYTSTWHSTGMPFGEKLVDICTTDHDIRFKFTGKERDSETGFDYFGARYYSSDLSVWLSVDPMSDKYPSTSGYMYTLGNPIMFTDPWGMSPDDPPAGSNPDEYSSGGNTTMPKGTDPSLEPETPQGYYSGNGKQIPYYKDGSTSNNTSSTYSQSPYNSDGGYLYYIAEFTGWHGHAMVWNPHSNKMYEIHVPDYGADEQSITTYLWWWASLQGDKKAQIYVFEMPKEYNKFTQASDRDGDDDGSIDLYYIKVWVPSLSAAEAFFESHEGEAWRYSLVSRNCKHYARKGLKAGGAKLKWSGPIPVMWRAGEFLPFDESIINPKKQ